MNRNEYTDLWRNVYRNVRQRTDESLPTYIFSWSMIEGRPHIITMRPAFRGGENADEQQTRFYITTALTNRILARVRQAGLIGTRNQLMERVTGSLIAFSTDDGPQRSAPLGRSINLNDLTPQVIEELMETITQSETDTQIYQVEWRFVINPMVFVQGGSDKVKPPKWLKIVDQSWSSFADERGPISCAAVSLVLAMNGSVSRYVQYTTNVKRLVKDSRNLQNTMGWSDLVNGTELAKFVEKFPKYRLSILMTEKSSRYYTFTGSEFESENKGNIKIT
jgi:hypothetical protein